MRYTLPLNLEMKTIYKIIYTLFALSLCLTACNTKKAEEEAKTGEIQFEQNDFAFFTPSDDNGNGYVLMGLGIAEENIQVNDLTMAYYEGCDYDCVKKNIILAGSEDNKAEAHDVIYHMAYKGGNLPIYTFRNISTTGYMSQSNDYCSAAEEVVSAYGIDKESENYITDKKDEDNYTIELIFDRNARAVVDDKNGKTTENSVTRRKFKSGETISEDGCYCIMRFTIRDGYVHGVDMYQKGK